MLTRKGIFAAYVVLLISSIVVGISVVSRNEHNSFDALSFDAIPTGPEVGYFWQITDPHIDRDYLVGGNPDCGLPLCCRDTVANQTKKAGLFGDYLCDLPPTTFQAALDFVRDFPVKSSFIVYGGDDVPHDIWHQSEQYNLGYVKFSHAMLNKTFAGIPVYPTIGNHDPYPVDQLDAPPRSSWFLGPLSELWADWLPADAVASVKGAGWYSVAAEPGLRVVNINTQWADKLNFWLYRNLTDPAGQLAWLAKELALAQANKERVLLVGHIPPGQDDRDINPKVLPEFNNALEKIIDQFSSVVICQMYGHTHVDSFRVFRDVATGQKARGIAFTSSAVTPFSNHNPGVRLYMYNRTNNFELIDYTTYYFDLGQANAQGKITWQAEYSAKTAYGLADLTPASWMDLTQRMKTTPALFDAFNTYYYTSHGNRVCDGNCKQQQICSLQYINWQRYILCAEPQ